MCIRDSHCVGLLVGDYDAGSIALDFGGGLIGRAVDEQGRPVAGAHLAAQQARFDPSVAAIEEDWQTYAQLEPVVSDISDDDGRFELGGFWPGTAMVRITADGHPFTAREDLPIEAGARRDIGDVVLPSGVSLRGQVVDASGAPVAGALVAVENGYSHSDREGRDTVMRYVIYLRKTHVPQARTDGEGRFAITGLEPANYSLFVDAEEFEPLRLN